MPETPSPKLHQIIGTTVYIGRTELTTIYGPMMAFTFQDLIHKGYIIALTHGDLNSPQLYTRLHSSCVTSQLMRSLDCDCVQQLNGAIKKICSSNGILFYLIQQGRGCGYVGKSRACMSVQYWQQQRNINTFQAYESLGMKHDYRDYTGIRDINKILQIQSEFILLTNNPDKIEKFTKLGIKLKGVQSIEITPNPFNQTYLHSKQQYGHILYQAKTKVQKYIMPYPRIKPFTPYSLPQIQRFVKVASYYLPIKPINNKILLSPTQYSQFCHPSQNSSSPSYQLVHNPATNNTLAYYTQMTQQQIYANSQHLTKPNWFQINVHYDIVTNQDYLLLKYGSNKNNQVPIVRIHSQSLFNRFPLVDREYKARYKKSLDYIIKNGYGYMLIFYNDGRGSGLSYVVLDMEGKAEGKETEIGVERDKRDYYGAIQLLSHYLEPGKKIDLLCGLTSKQRLRKQVERSQIKVRKYINLASESQAKGVASLETRLNSIKDNLNILATSIDVENLMKVTERIKKAIKQGKSIFSTGIGSSEAHSRYVQTLFDEKIKHINPMQVQALAKEINLLIVFSQGLSPNIICCLQGILPEKLIIITSVDPTVVHDNAEKQAFLQKMKQGKCLFLTYPKQDPDDTLIRITGPFLSFFLAAVLYLTRNQPSTPQIVTIIQSLHSRTLETLHHCTLTQQKCNKFIQQLALRKNVILCCDYPSINFIINIRFKFIQGAMLNCHIIDYANFSHGTYQFMQNQYNKNKYCIWFITKKQNKYHEKAIKMLAMVEEGMSYVSYYEQEQCQLLPLRVESEANYMVRQLVQMLGIDQYEWDGKNRQKILYEVYK